MCRPGGSERHTPDTLLLGSGLNSFDSAFFSRCASICFITAGSSILARACPVSTANALGITLTVPPHSSQVVISILNTRLRRCAQVIAACCSTGDRSSPFIWRLALLPRFDGVTRARCLLFGANTPWKRVRLALGLGTRAASRAMKSNGSKITWIVPYPKHSLRS
jgi:hypothetical protein